MKSTTLKLALLAAVIVAIQACGLTEEEPTAAPAPEAVPPVDDPAPSGQQDDWLAEYNRLLGQIQAGEEVQMPAASEAEAAPAVILPPAQEPTPTPEVEVAVIEPVEDEVPPPAVIIPPAAQPEPTPISEPVPQTQPVSPPPAPLTTFDDADVSQLLAQSRAHAAMVDERTARLVASYLEAGLQELDAGNLEGAHQYFGSALELDPGDPAARDLYNRTGMLLGGSQESLGTIAQSARDRAAANRDQQQYLVRHRIQQGQEALAAGDAAAATGHFEDAMTMLRSSPDLAPGSALESEVAGLLMQAKAAALNEAQRREARILDRSLERQAELDEAQATSDERRVEQLMRTANDAFMRDDFGTAEDALEQVLRIDRDNPEALELWRVANRARHDEVDRSTRRSYVREWRKTFDDLEHSAVPQTSLMVFPDEREWAEISERGSKKLGFDKVTPSLDDEAVRERLQEVRIPVNFDNISLEEAIAHLSEVSGVNMVLSQDVQDNALDNEYNLLDRARLSIDRILKILLEDLSSPPLSYSVRDGVVQVITLDEARSDYALQMYDIRDLTVTPSDYPSEDFNLLPSGTDPESFRDGVQDEEPQPYIAEDALQTLIEENIAPDSWTDDPERTITLLPGTLVVRQTPDVHAQINRLLEDLRANTKTLVHIEARFLEVEDTFLEDVGVDIRGLDSQILEDYGQSGVGFGTPTDPLGIGTGNDAGAYYDGQNGDLKGRVENLFDFTLGETGTVNNTGGLSLEALWLSDVDVQAVLRAVNKTQSVNIVNAPSLTLRSGQRGSIHVLTKRTYVYDFEPEIAQGSVIAQPELQNADEGIVLDVRAVASSDQRFITLEMRPTLARLVRDASGDPLPDATVSLATGNASDVTIEVPELLLQRVRTTATIPDGATLMLGGLKKSVEQDYESGVPFLSDLPFVGFAFTRKGEYTSRRKVIILLKATLVLPEEREPTVGFAR